MSNVNDLINFTSKSVLIGALLFGLGFSTACSDKGAADGASSADSTNVGVSESNTDPDDFYALVMGLKDEIEKNPQNVDAYYKRGTAYFSRLYFPDAVADFDECVKLKPQDATMFVARARALERMGKYKAALDDCNQAVKLAPKDVEALCLRAYMNKKNKLEMEAEADIQKVREIDPENSTFKNFQSSDFKEIIPGPEQLFYAQGDTAELSRKIERFPKDDLYYFQRSGVYFLMQKYALALADAERFLELRPDLAKMGKERRDEIAKAKTFDEHD